MKSLIKVGLIAVLTVIVLIVGLGIALSFKIDQIVHTGVETIGSTLTRTEVRLDEVEVSFLNGSGTLKGFFIGNPKGFKSEKAFYLGEIDVKIALPSLLTDRILIERIYIREPQIVFENSSIGNNLNQLRENVNEVITLREGNEEDPLRFEITEFILEEGRVEINIPNRKMTIPVPKIEFHDMGKESGGITSDELVEDILGEITFNVQLKVRDVAGVAVGKGVEVGIDVSDIVTGTAKDTFKGVKKLFKKGK